MYQKLQCTNTSSWKKFCLFLVIFFVQFANINAQNYVDISLAEIDATGTKACPPPQVKPELVIHPNYGLYGDSRGWSANLYLKSETGGKNTIHDLSWWIAPNSTYSNTTYLFDNVDIWMYEYSVDEFPDYKRPDVEAWANGTQPTPSGVKNLVKVLNNGTLKFKNQSSECIGGPNNQLTTPYDYSGNYNLVIYIQKKTKQTNPAGYISYRQNKVDDKKRSLANWAGEDTDILPLNSTITSTSASRFARVILNKDYTGATVKSFTCDGNNGKDLVCLEKCSVNLNNPTFCEGDNADLKATPINNSGAVSYNWELLPLGVNNPGNISSFKISKPGNYKVTINTKNTDGTDCVASKTVTVVLNPKPVITNITESTCSGLVFNVSPVANTTNSNIIPTGTKYTWTVTSPGTSGATNQNIAQNTISQTLTNQSNSIIDIIYKVTATTGISTNQCSSDFDLTIKVNPVPLIPNITKTVCSGETFDLTPVDNGTTIIVPSGTTYEWLAPTGPTEISGGSPNKPTSETKIVQKLSNSSTTIDKTATYSITAKTNTTPVCSKTFTATITVKPKIDKPDTAGIVQPTCGVPNGTLNLNNYSASNTYVFIPSTDISLITTSTPKKISGKAGIYKFAALNNSCSSDTLTIEFKAPQGAAFLETTPSVPSLCVGDSLVIKAWTDNTKGTKSTPKSNPAWSSDNANVTLKDTVNGSFTIKKVIAKVGGISKITYTDVNGCESVKNITVNALPFLDGPNSVCEDLEITLKAWTDNSKTASSSPKVNTPWTIKDPNNDTIAVSNGTDLTSSIIKGLKSRLIKGGESTVIFTDNNSCSSEKSIKVFKVPVLDVVPNVSSLCSSDSLVLKAFLEAPSATNPTPTKSVPSIISPWSNDNNVLLKDTLNSSFTIKKVIASEVLSNTNSVVTFTDINGCIAKKQITINALPSSPSITNVNDLVQVFCEADNAQIKNLKPMITDLVWFDKNGIEKNPNDYLIETDYYATLKNSLGCYTKKLDRKKVEVKINKNPGLPNVTTSPNPTYCEMDYMKVGSLPQGGGTSPITIKWFYLKTPTDTVPKLPSDTLRTGTYVAKSLLINPLNLVGCYSKAVPINVNIITVPKPNKPTFKLCANNQPSFKLEDVYPGVSNYYFFDASKNLLFPNKVVSDGEIYYVSQSDLNGCLSDTLMFAVKVLKGFSFPVTGPIVLTPAFCKVDGPTLAAIEAKYSALPTSGSIFWYDAQNSSLTNDLLKTADLGGTAYSLWIAVKDENGCFSKKQQVDFTIDPGKKPDLKPIELCKTTDYTLTNLDVANISNPKGTLTWYLSQTGVGLAPPTVPKNSSQKYWASYKETATSCEGERKDLNINWIDLSQPFSIDDKNQKFCKTANKTVDDLNPYPFTDANIAWFENTSTNIPYPAIDLLADKIYYASQYQITSAGDYCVNPNRIPVNVALYSNKIYPIVKESVCSKQNGSIEFINPPAGLTFDWYEQSNPTTLDFTGAKYTKPLENQSFKIKIKDSFGCEEEVSVSLPECSDSPIPQILSPNNDAYNNKWVINYSGKYKNVQVRIFNRWGNEVFTSAIPYKDDWDGKRNNDYLPSGTYYYVIDKGNGDPIESGYIELIK